MTPNKSFQRTVKSCAFCRPLNSHVGRTWRRWPREQEPRVPGGVARNQSLAPPAPDSALPRAGLSVRPGIIDLGRGQRDATRVARTSASGVSRGGRTCSACDRGVASGGPHVRTSIRVPLDGRTRWCAEHGRVPANKVESGCAGVGQAREPSTGLSWECRRISGSEFRGPNFGVRPRIIEESFGE
jgi:hypothetical protein